MKWSSPKSLSLIGYYIVWHYGRAYFDMYRIWMNFLWFVFYFFSIGTLLNTFFEPWKRMGEEYPTGFNPAVAVQTFIVNSLMRVVGAISRLIVICIGLILASIVFLLGLAVFVVWTVMPIILAMLLVMGVTLLVFG